MRGEALSLDVEERMYGIGAPLCRRAVHRKVCLLHRACMAWLTP